jgi:hypothetical protein
MTCRSTHAALAGSLKPGGSPKTNDVADRSVRLRPATRSLREVLDERGPLTGPVTGAGAQALLAVRTTDR